MAKFGLSQLNPQDRAWAFKPTCDMVSQFVFSFSDLRLPQVTFFSIFPYFRRLSAAASRSNFSNFFRLVAAASRPKLRLATVPVPSQVGVLADLRLQQVGKNGKFISPGVWSRPSGALQLLPCPFASARPQAQPGKIGKTTWFRQGLLSVWALAECEWRAAAPGLKPAARPNASSTFGRRYSRACSRNSRRTVLFFGWRTVPFVFVRVRVCTFSTNSTTSNMAAAGWGLQER